MSWYSAMASLPKSSKPEKSIPLSLNNEDVENGTEQLVESLSMNDLFSFCSELKKALEVIGIDMDSELKHVQEDFKSRRVEISAKVVELMADNIVLSRVLKSGILENIPESFKGMNCNKEVSNGRNDC